MVAHRKVRRSRRFGCFKRRGAFLPDSPRRGEAAFRVGAGPVDVLATHVAASAIERVRKNDVPSAPRAKEPAGIAARFKIPGTLEILAAIEKIRRNRAPSVTPGGHAAPHGTATHDISDEGRPAKRAGPAATAGGFRGVSSRGERLRSGNVWRAETARTITSRV